MKKFLLEFGRDFIFIDEEYHLQVGNNDYYVDLLFYHRELQCLVAIDLKIDDDIIYIKYLISETNCIYEYKLEMSDVL